LILELIEVENEDIVRLFPINLSKLRIKPYKFNF